MEFKMSQNLKYSLSIYCLFFLTNWSFAQNAEGEYKTALKEFQIGNVNSCLLYLNNAQTYLTGSNAKIESLKCFAFVAKEDWINAAIAYDNYVRLIPSHLKNGEAYSALADLKKEIWNELENIEKKKKEEQEKEIKDDLALAKEQEKSLEASYNSTVNRINQANEKELYSVAMQSKDKELLTLYKNEISDSGSNLNAITLEIDKQNNPTSFLLSAIKKDDLQDFKYLLDLGADAQWKNQEGESLLHLTILHDAYKVYDELIRLNVDVEQRDKAGNTPLIKAIINNKVKFFKQLLNNNASITATNSVSQQSPFYYTLMNSNVVLSEILIKNGINLNEYIVINNANFTPLYLSVNETKSKEFAEFLLINGAEIDKISDDGQTPLMAAVDNNNLDFVNLLLNNGASINFQDEYKQTVLHLAIRNENSEMVLYLIQRGGANKKIKDSLNNSPYALSKHINKDISKIVKKNKSYIDLSTDYRNRNHEIQYLNKVEKIKKRNEIVAARKDRFFYTYAYDSLTNYGFSVGTVNQYGIGAYITVRLNADILTTSGQNGTVNNNGEVTGGQFENWGNDWRFQDKTKNGVAEGMLGLTKKITYPLWLYAGAGVSYNQTYWEMDIYDNLGDFHDTDWLKNSDEQSYSPIFESGIIVDLAGLNIRAGVKTDKFEEFILTLGVGFSLSR